MTRVDFIAQAAEELRVAGVATEHCGKTAGILWDAALAVTGENVFTKELAEGVQNFATDTLLDSLESFKVRV